MVFAIGILFIALLIGVELVMRNRRQKAVEAAPLVTQRAYQMNADNIRMPAGLYFHPTHTWGHMSEKGTIHTGLDDFIMHVVGRISTISAPDPGSRVQQGDQLFAVKQGDNEILLKSPVNGRITVVNNRVLKDPNVLSKLPYGENWICEITPDDWAHDTHRLFLGSAAGSWLKQEMGRLRDFFASLTRAKTPELYAVALQDGGEVAEGVLQYQTPDVWQSFQDQFLDADPA